MLLIAMRSSTLSEKKVTHWTPSSKIGQLTILRECMKRAAEEELPLRQVFDDVCRTSGASAQHIAFAEVESSMHKRHRVAMPSLPSSPQISDQAVSGSRFAQFSDSVFYRGQLGDSNNDTALLFASDGQLDLLRPAHLIYVDSRSALSRRCIVSCSQSS